MQSFMHTAGSLLLVFLCSSISAADTPQPIARSASITHRVHTFYQRHPYMTYAAGGILCIGCCLVGYAIYPTSVQKIIFKKVSGDGNQVEHKTTCQKKKLDALGNTSIYNCLREIDPTISEESQRPIYKIYPVINSTNEKTAIAQIDTEGVFCKSNQSVRSFWAEKKLLTTQKNITIYFKEDDSMAEKIYPVRVYSQHMEPMTWQLKGSDPFLSTLAKRQEELYHTTYTEKNTFLYGKISKRSVTFEKKNYGQRKPADIYLQNAKGASVAQLIIDSHTASPSEVFPEEALLVITATPILHIRFIFFCRTDEMISSLDGPCTLESNFESFVSNYIKPTTLYVQEALGQNTAGWEMESMTPTSFEERISNKKRVKKLLPLKEGEEIGQMLTRNRYKTPLEAIDQLVFYADQ